MIDPALLQAQQFLIQQINGCAGSSRARNMEGIDTVGQEATYLLKLSEWKAYATLVASGGTPVATDYPFMNAEAIACNMTLDAVASFFGTTATAWIAMAANIEAIRRSTILSIQNATTVDAVMAIWPRWP